MFNEDIYSCKHWKYDEDIVHLKDFDHYKKYGKFFVVRYLNFGFTYLFFGKDDVYVALDIFENNIEKNITLTQTSNYMYYYIYINIDIKERNNILNIVKTDKFIISLEYAGTLKKSLTFRYPNKIANHMFDYFLNIKNEIRKDKLKQLDMLYNI